MTETSPICSIPQPAALPPLRYEVHTAPTVCSCGALNVRTEVFAVNLLRSRGGWGAPVTHRVVVKEFLWQVPVVQVQARETSTFICDACIVNLDMSNLPLPPEPSGGIVAAFHEPTAKAAKPKTFRTAREAPEPVDLLKGLF